MQKKWFLEKLEVWSFFKKLLDYFETNTLFPLYPYKTNFQTNIINYTNNFVTFFVIYCMKVVFLHNNKGLRAYEMKKKKEVQHEKQGENAVEGEGIHNRKGTGIKVLGRKIG